jgi:hypothetical protein
MANRPLRASGTGAARVAPERHIGGDVDDAIVRLAPRCERRQTMCLNCGCGEPETRHKETDITADDVRKASSGMSMDQTVQNMRTSLDKMASGQSGAPSGQSTAGVSAGS